MESKSFKFRKKEKTFRSCARLYHQKFNRDLMINIKGEFCKVAEEGFPADDVNREKIPKALRGISKEGEFLTENLQHIYN
jgi:hypothetical protein